MSLSRALRQSIYVSSPTQTANDDQDEEQKQLGKVKRAQGKQLGKWYLCLDPQHQPLSTHLQAALAETRGVPQPGQDGAVSTSTHGLLKQQGQER